MRPVSLRSILNLKRKEKKNIIDMSLEMPMEVEKSRFIKTQRFASTICSFLFSHL